MPAASSTSGHHPAEAVPAATKATELPHRDFVQLLDGQGSRQYIHNQKTGESKYLPAVPAPVADRNDGGLSDSGAAVLLSLSRVR